MLTYEHCKRLFVDGVKSSGDCLGLELGGIVVNRQKAEGRRSMRVMLTGQHPSPLKRWFFRSFVLVVLEVWDTSRFPRVGVWEVLTADR